MISSIDKKIESIKKSITKGDLDVAIVDLSAYINEKRDSFSNEINLKIDKSYSSVSARYNVLKNNNVRGVVDLPQFQSIFAELTIALVDLLYEISDYINSSENFST